MRIRRGIAVVALLAGGLVGSPARANAEVRGCTGAYTGPASCTFELEPGDVGFTITVQPTAGTSTVAVRGRCCRVVNPMTGEAVANPVDGEYTWYKYVICGTSAPGYCRYDADRAPAGVVFDGKVACDLAALDDPSNVAGDWSCVPLPG